MQAIEELEKALGCVAIADKERAKAKQAPDPDLVVYYIEHADWAIREALVILKQEKEE